MASPCQEAQHRGQSLPDSPKGAAQMTLSALQLLKKGLWQGLATLQRGQIELTMSPKI